MSSKSKEVKPAIPVSEVAAGSSSTSAAVSLSSSKHQQSKVLPLTASLQSNLHILLARLGRLLKYQALLRSKVGNGIVTPQQLGLLPGWTELVAAAQKWQRDVEALNTWVSEAQDALTIELVRARKREAVRAEEEAKRAEVEAAEKKAKSEQEEADRIKREAQTAAANAAAAAAAAATNASNAKGQVNAGGASIDGKAPLDATPASGTSKVPASAGIIDLTDDDDNDDDEEVKIVKSNSHSDGKHPRDEDPAGEPNSEGSDTKRQKTGASNHDDDNNNSNNNNNNNNIPTAATAVASTPQSSIVATPDPATLLATLTSQSTDPLTKSNPSGDFDISAMGNLPDLFKVDLTSFMSGGAPSSSSDIGSGTGTGTGTGSGDPQSGSGGSMISGGAASSLSGGGGGGSGGGGGHKVDVNSYNADGNFDLNSDQLTGIGGDLDFNFDPNTFSMDGMDAIGGAGAGGVGGGAGGGGGVGGLDQFGSGAEGGGEMGGIDFNAALEGVDWGSLMDIIGQGQGGV